MPHNPKLALKIDVDTLRGMRHGVPRLLETLQKHQAQASFFFALGPSNGGQALRKAFRLPRGHKAKPLSPLEHYGPLALLQGPVLTPPEIGKRSAHIIRAVHEAGFETAIHGWDQAQWQSGVDRAPNDWIEVDMARSAHSYEKILGQRPTSHSAPGWRTNRHGLRLTQRLGLAYASDTRGTSPYLPVIDGEPIACPQIPTTLPTLDELIGCNGITPENVAERLLCLTLDAPSSGHVYTLRAELEGMKLHTILEKLLEGWKAQGYQLVSCRQLAEGLDKHALPRCQVIRGEVPGRSGHLSLQGPEFLTD